MDGRVAQPRVVVLVEGDSDAVVVRVLAASRAIPVDVVAMGGVTNARRYAEEQRDSDPAVVLLGLCDVRERRFLERLQPPLAGVFVCDPDLEAELIGCLGPPAVEEALDELGDLGRYRTFQGQPEWRGRAAADQLRRFAGAGSGRKRLLAERLAVRLTPANTPGVLSALLDAAASARTA